MKTCAGTPPCRGCGTCSFVFLLYIFVVSYANTRCCLSMQMSFIWGDLCRDSSFSGGFLGNKRSSSSSAFFFFFKSGWRDGRISNNSSNLKWKPASNFLCVCFNFSSLLKQGGFWDATLFVTLIIMILMENKLPLFDIQQNYTLLDANADEMHISPRQSATAASVTPNMQPAPGEKRWMRRAEGGTSVRDKLKAVCPSSHCSDLSAEAGIIFLFPNSQREPGACRRRFTTSVRR